MGIIAMLKQKLLIALVAVGFVGGGLYTVALNKSEEKPLFEMKIEDVKKPEVKLIAEKRPAPNPVVKKPEAVAPKTAIALETVVPQPKVEEQKKPEPVPTPEPESVIYAEPAPQLQPPAASEPEPPVVSQAEPVKVLIFEIQAGTEVGGTEDEFIKLYNPTDKEIDLSGWALKKKTSSGSSQNLVSSGAFSGKIAAKGHFVIAHENYKGVLLVNLTYSANSNNLSYTNNSAVLYGSDGSVMDEVSWAEIAKDQVWQRM